MQVLVPVCDVGLGTGTSAVHDAKHGRAVQLRQPELHLVGNTLYVAGRVIATEAGVRLVMFGERSAWVAEAIPDERSLAA